MPYTKQYTLKNYGYCGRIVIVFDGYEDESSTKYQEHFNRSSKGVMAPDVHIQFVIFKPLSYCFKETVGFDAKASFGNRPLSRLIRWCNKPGDITKEFWEKAIHFHGIFHRLKITNCIYISMEVASQKIRSLEILSIKSNSSSFFKANFERRKLTCGKVRGMQTLS